MVLLSSDIELLSIATNPTPEGRRLAETPMSKLQFDPEAPSLADRLAPEASITSVKTAQLGAAGRGRSGGSAPKKKYVRFACVACYLHDVLGYAFQTDVETPTEPVAVGSALSRGTRLRLNEEAAVDVGERLGKAWYAHCCNALAKTVKRWDIVGCSGKERNTVRQASCGAASTGGGEAANEAEPYTADYMVHECLLKEGLVDGRVLFSEDANNLEYRTFAYEYWDKGDVKLLVPAWQINVEAMRKAEGPFNAKQAFAGATSLNLRLMANPTAPGTLISRQGQCLEPLPPPWHNKYINWLAIWKLFQRHSNERSSFRMIVVEQSSVTSLGAETGSLAAAAASGAMGPSKRPRNRTPPKTGPKKLAPVLPISDVKQARKKRGSGILSAAATSAMNGHGQHHIPATRPPGAPLTSVPPQESGLHDLLKQHIAYINEKRERLGSRQQDRGMMSPGGSSASIQSAGYMSPTPSTSSGAAASSYESQWSCDDLAAAASLVAVIHNNIVHSIGGSADIDSHDASKPSTSWGKPAWEHLVSALEGVADELEEMLLGGLPRAALPTKAFFLHVFTPMKSGRIINTGRAYVAVASFMRSAFRKCTCSFCITMLSEIQSYVADHGGMQGRLGADIPPWILKQPTARGK